MDQTTIQSFISQAEQDGLVQRTFRRLDPDKQRAVIDGLLSEAAAVGPDRVRIQAVANRAGVAVGSMYQYFPNRENLLEFAIRLCARSWVAMFDTHIPMLAALPLREGLRAHILGGLALNEVDQGVVRFFGQAAYQGLEGKVREALTPIAAKMRLAVHEMLVQAKNRGDIRADIDVEATARALNAFLIALGDAQLFPYLNNYYQLMDENMAFERVLNAAIDLALRGLE